MRSVLNSLMFLVMSLPLVAQQVGTGASSTSPATARTKSQSLGVRLGTTVKLVAIDEISSATLKAGSKVRFLIWRDVAVNGEVIIPAGTPIDAVVTRVQSASKDHHRDATVTLRLQEIEAAGYHICLTMNDDFAPENIEHRHSKLRDIVETGGEAAVLIALAPIVIPMGIAMTTSNQKPNGDDLVLKPCFHADVYVRSAKRVKRAHLTQPSPALEPALAGCADSTESLEFDGKFLEALNKGTLKID